MKVVFPSGRYIGPGFRTIMTVREEEEEVWFMGHLIETKINRIEETHGVEVPDPGFDGPEDDENSWPARGTFTFADKTFTVVRDDDIGFWGFAGGEPLNRQDYVRILTLRNDRAITQGFINGWWDLESTGTGELIPVNKTQTISIAAMKAQNKTLMAHLMVDLGIFKSVGEAKRNGWDKPLELGLHDLGPKKKRVTVEIIP